MKHQLLRAGYYNIREFPVGTTALRDYVNTVDIVVGIKGTSYQRRYSYDTASLAEEALNKWNGVGDPSGPWLKCKAPDELRLGPGWKD
ncbi:MAG: hypothetical protein RL156_1773 [Bacteroidota bacterium]|jgi:hypothetical protein